MKKEKESQEGEVRIAKDEFSNETGMNSEAERFLIFQSKEICKIYSS